MNIKQGDTIGIIALSGECDKTKIEQAKKNIEKLGFNVRLSKNIYDVNRYLAGSDKDKIEELHNFFLDNDIKMIICARGGYGAIRLINKIDYNIIKSNPKPFCGYSDATALLLMFYKRAGLVTYHSFMAQSDSESISEYFKDFKFEHKVIKNYNLGIADGVLWGGNLSTVVSLCGQDFLPEDDFIFFAEDINEPVYKIDKMFQQLININDFKSRCKAIVLGDFLEVDNQLWLEEYFKELINTLRIPVKYITGITHSEHKIILPVGNRALLDDNKLVIHM